MPDAWDGDSWEAPHWDGGVWVDADGIPIYDPGDGPPSGSVSTNVDQNFADTFAPMKIIGLSNGSTRAIPASADPPAMPGGLATTPRLSSIRVAWGAAARASSYIVYRSDIGQVATVLEPSFRDLAIAVGGLYGYQVQAVDQYGQRSQVTSPVSAFVDPALNVAPTVAVRSWPATLPTDGRSYIRVNGSDPNAQVLALTLGVSVGSIAATDDPSVWIYTP